MEKVTPFQRAVPSVAIPNLTRQTLPAKTLKNGAYTFWTCSLTSPSFPYHWTVPLLGSIRNGQCKHPYAWAIEDSPQINPAVSDGVTTRHLGLHLCQRSCFELIAWTIYKMQGSTSRLTQSREAKLNARKNASLSHNALEPLFHPG